MMEDAVTRIRDEEGAGPGTPPPAAVGVGEHFRRFAHRVSERVGSSWAFLTALGVVLVWGATGPIFGFSDTWQLVINTGTTIVTFLMVFLIQNTQNRDARVVHLKLDELLRAASHARNRLVNLEALPDEDLEVLQREFEALQAKGRLAPRGRARRAPPGETR